MARKNKDRRDQGRVIEVSSINIGDELVKDQFINDTVLYLDDVSEFDEDGGQVSIAGVVYSYTTIDDDSSTLTLVAPGLTTDAADATDVLIYPLATEMVALVNVDEEDDAIYARIPMSMERQIVDRIRDPSEQESVEIELQGNEWVIVDILGQADTTYQGGGAKTLDELDDVTAPAGSASDRQYLGYDLASAQWKPQGPVVREGTALPADPKQFPWQFFVKHI